MSTTQTSPLQPIPYLSFDGNCKEALHFYEGALGGKIAFIMTNGQSPMAEHFPPETHDRIINAQFFLPGGMMLMAGDAMGNAPYEGIKGVSLALNFDTTEEGEKIFNALSVGGTVSMPWAPTFWAKMFGMVDDKYGVSWLVNGEVTPMESPK